MKDIRLLTIVCFFIFMHQTLNAQEEKWIVGVAPQLESISFRMGEDAAIKVSNRENIRVGSSRGMNFIVKRNINLYSLGLEIGYIQTKYNLLIDSDFGDLDEIIDFSDPIKNGDYENLYKLNYKNNYFKIGAYFYQTLEKDQEKVFQPYLGFGLDMRLRTKSIMTEEYSDKTTHIVFYGTVPNNLATFDQKEEAINYFNKDRAKNMVFIRAGLGLKFQFANSTSFVVEPYLNFATKSYQPEFMNRPLVMGINHIIKHRF